MPAYYAPRYEEFLTRLTGTFAVRAGFTDIAPSSQARYLAAALARLMDELSYATLQQQQCWNIDTATGDDLDARAGELSAGTLTRAPANAARGQVVFYAAQPGATVTVPAGTQVASDDGTVFSTVAPATLAPTNPALLPGHLTGQDTPLVGVVAQDPGASGNLASGTLTRLQSRPTGIDGVQNLTPTQFGLDAESDDGLRARIRNYAASLARSTPQALVGATLGAQDATTGARIADAKLLESETTPGSSTLYIDDGFGEAASTAPYANELLTQGLPGPGGTTAGGGETRLTLAHVPVSTQVPPVLVSDQRGTLAYLTDFTYDPLNGVVTLSAPLSNGESVQASYTAYTGLIALAQKIVDGDPADPMAYPGYRAAGTRVTVSTPQVVSVSIQAVLSVDGTFDVPTVQAQAESVLVSLVNNLRIGEPVRAASLVGALMNLDGVVNVSLVAPASDLIVGQGQLARTDSSRVQVA